MNHINHQTINIDNGMACIDCQIASEASLVTKMKNRTLKAINGLTHEKIVNMEIERMVKLQAVMREVSTNHETPEISKQNSKLIIDNLQDMQEYASK